MPDTITTAVPQQTPPQDAILHPAQDGLTIISTEETLQQETYKAFLEEKTFVEGV